MSRIKIKNIGPISDVDITINRLNVIIGKQSSGKSTIAKIVSFCQWLEKDIIAHQEKDYVDSGFLKKQLLDYHKISNYFNEGACINYDGDYITFDYHSISDFSISLTDNFKNSTNGKVAYIPAERNLVALTNISSLDMERNYVRDFLFNWLSVCNKILKKDAISIIDLDVRYYYDEERKKPRIILNNEKELGLEEVSSGMQSIIPLYIYVLYIIKWVFEHEEEISYDKYSVFQKSFLKAITHETDDDLIETVSNNPEFQQKLKKSISLLKKVTTENMQDGKLKDLVPVSNLIERLGKLHYANLIIEEPELNLFPQTQVRLMYDMLKIIDFSRDRLLLTTHSPYILYAINNCMLSYKVKDNLDEDEKESLQSYGSQINPEMVSIWQIKDNGTLSNIKTSPLGLVGEHYFNEIMNETLDEYHLMLDYTE